jgi:hypothetical protein
MPTPDGREWLTPKQIAEGFLWKAFCHEFQNEQWFEHPTNPKTGKLGVSMDSPLKQRFCAAMVMGFERTNYQMEFTLARLFEMFKDALQRDDIPDVGEVTRANIKTMFTEDFLNQLDIDGELL